MCGIVGYFRLKSSVDDGRALLKTMCDKLIHRGPDDEGYFVDDHCGLGMRRLSIIDLTSGHQPIENEDGSLHIVFNGEIYNYQDLQPSLQKQGHQLRTSSDTEVILHQYEQDGPTCLQHFNGMFAIAIYDQKQRTLFLARDRMGVKPLYYYWDGTSFLFASEIKALIASGLITKTLNEKALWDYLTFRYVPQPETMWENIHKLLPGHTLTISEGSLEPSIKRYWDIPYDDLAPVRTADEYLQEFEKLFLDAVRLRLIADVPVGVLLSGGLDSSAVAAAISKVHNTKLDSFTVAFKDSPKTNELKYARQVSRFVETNHHEIEIGEKEFCEFLPQMAYFTDEPLADLASVPLFYVSQLAHGNVKVVLSGEGSDEILGGYHFDQAMRSWDRIRKYQALPGWVRRTMEPLLKRTHPKFNGWLESASVPLERLLIERPFNMTSLFDSATKRELLKTGTRFPDSMAIVQQEAMNAHSRQPLHQALYIYCQSWLVEDLLMKADRMTMANSIELRVPFLDYRLVEWAARTPTWVKVNQTCAGYVTKWVLREFARQHLPTEIIQRPKQGFPVPVYDWLGTRLKVWATDLLCSKKARIYDWLDHKKVQALLVQGVENDCPMPLRHRLWQILILETWMQTWLP